MGPARAKGRERPLLVHDVFGMIPPPTEADGEDVQARYETIASGRSPGLGEDTYYGYEPDLISKVRQNFERFGLSPEDNAVSLVRGLFQDTIVGDEPVALAHIDGDWYESVRTCLERIGPRLVPGGVMVIDDYFKWSGCRSAVDEFLAEHPDRYRRVKRTGLQIEPVCPPVAQLLVGRPPPRNHPHVARRDGWKSLRSSSSRASRARAPARPVHAPR